MRLCIHDCETYIYSKPNNVLTMGVRVILVIDLEIQRGKFTCTRYEVVIIIHMGILAILSPSRHYHNERKYCQTIPLKISSSSQWAGFFGCFVE